MPKSKLVPHLAFAFFSISILVPAQAMAMRCGTHIITRGDTQAKVLRYCGEPTQTSSRYITRGARHSALIRQPGATGDISLTSVERVDYYLSEEVLVEDWVFNFGPNKLMRRVIFENGEVVEVDTLDYGYHE